LPQAWRLIRTMCVQDLPSMQTICCRLALMDFEWMQQRVRVLVLNHGRQPDVKPSLLDIAASDIANITSRLSSSNNYITQEVIWGGVVDPNEYVGNGESSVHPW
jgi:hypothetical protein